MDSLIQEVYEVIIQNPGIDTPEACVKIHEDIDNKDNLEGHALAHWLDKHYRTHWNKTCTAVDELLDDGSVSFSDDGELRATGYTA